MKLRLIIQAFFISIALFFAIFWWFENRYIQSINDGLKGVTDGLFEEKGTKSRHENKRGRD